MKLFLAAFIASMAGLAAAQTPAPAQSAAPAQPAVTAQPAKPAARPLILRLDEVDGPRMSVGPTATEKPPEKDLPTLGGRPNGDWTRSDRTFPIDSERMIQNNGAR
jgi:hypothetical protein